MLTRKQSELLALLSAQAAKSDVSPSFQEMAAALGIKSKSGVSKLLDGLEERGFVRRLHGRARSIEVLKPSQGREAA